MPAFLALAILLAPNNTTADFYVSPKGNDAWTGKRADKPYKTVERARDAVRTFRTAHPDLKRPVVIRLRGGTYILNKPIKLDQEDAGAPGSPTLYGAYADEKPVISGGTPLKGFAAANGRWTLSLPTVAKGEWNFSQLFVGGERRLRPRLPKEGTFLTGQRLGPSGRFKTPGDDQLQFREGDIAERYHNMTDVEAVYFAIWDMGRMRVESIDTKTRVMSFTGPEGYDTTWGWIDTNRRYFLENVYEALGDPGQWYLDRKSGLLTVIPKPGDNLKKTEVIAPKIDQLLLINAAHLKFEGLTFAHTNWNLSPQGRIFPQAEADISAAIALEKSSDVVFKACNLKQTGGWGIDVGAECRNVTVESCRLTDLGAGGVKIGLMTYEPDESKATGHVKVKDCLIAGLGRLHPAAIGVWVGHSAFNEITDNEIADLYYTGVSIGWSWGYGKSGSHHNLVARNNIHDIGQGLLSDMGGIYHLGVAPGTVLRENCIHGIKSFDYGGWGIYTDEGSTGVLIQDNLVFDTSRAGFHQHYGKENVIKGNVFAFGGEAQIVRTRVEEHISFTMSNNIIVSAGPPILGSNWSGKNYKCDFNLYWKTNGVVPDFVGMSFEQWKATGQDMHSVIADPQFLDPANGDFRLKATSPALALGFKAMDPRFVRTKSKSGYRMLPPAFPLPK